MQLGSSPKGWISSLNINSTIGPRPVLADMLHKAGIPTLAIDIPMPNATYFGVDNYAAGVYGWRRAG